MKAADVPAWAKDAAKKVLKELDGRAGFDAWFDDIARATQREIESTLAEIIAAEAPAVTP